MFVQGAKNNYTLLNYTFNNELNVFEHNDNYSPEVVFQGAINRVGKNN